MSKTLSQEQVLALAEHVENAELQAHDITKVTNDFPDMTFEDAYDVQWEIRRRKEARGNKIVGMKMAQMGVEPSNLEVIKRNKSFYVESNHTN
jgi:2-oxo-3-hexenedioate decarboxylase